MTKSLDQISQDDGAEQDKAANRWEAAQDDNNQWLVVERIGTADCRDITNPGLSELKVKDIAREHNEHAALPRKE